MGTRTLYFALGAALALAACRKQEVEEPDLGYGYFPTSVGTWVEYQVDSLWRDDPADVLDSVSYRLLERIEEHYTDLEGRPCQRIHRYVRDTTGAWVVRDVWTSTMDAYAAEKTEENYRRLKLSFPVRDGRRWDTHVYGTGATGDPDRNDELLVAYEQVDEPWSTGGLAFNRTVLVKNTVPPNLVDTREFEERYADGVGMVYKFWEEARNIVVSNPNGSITLQYVGWRLRMTAVAHGS